MAGAATTGSSAAGATAAGVSGAATAALTAGLTTAAVGFSAASLAGAAGGFTTIVPGGGATTTTGRVATAPAGALATTAPVGGLVAMAGGAVCGMICGAERGWGTILRGSGRAGAAAGGAAATTGAAGGAAWTTDVAGGFAAVVTAGREGACPCRASSSSSFFLARIALRTSPGLEICERSILGVMPWGARDEAPPAWPADRVPRSNCARTFSASSDSSELEWVFPAPRPSSAKMSRICLLLTSISRARSLIRTLLIRLFSESVSSALSRS